MMAPWGGLSARVTHAVGEGSPSLPGRVGRGTYGQSQGHAAAGTDLQPDSRAKGMARGMLLRGRTFSRARRCC